MRSDHWIRMPDNTISMESGPSLPGENAIPAMVGLFVDALGIPYNTRQYFQNMLKESQSRDVQRLFDEYLQVWCEYWIKQCNEKFGLEIPIPEPTYHPHAKMQHVWEALEGILPNNKPKAETPGEEEK